MTSLNSGFRRTLVVAAAASLTLSLSACSAGQISQTASQVAAVDGGSGRVGDVKVDDVRIVTQPDDKSGQPGETRLGFTASFLGTGSTKDTVTLESIKVDGKSVPSGSFDPIGRECSAVAVVDENTGAWKDEAGQAGEDICLMYSEIIIPSSARMKVGAVLPVDFNFSDLEPITIPASIVVENGESGTAGRND